MKHRSEEPSESNTRTHLEYFKMDTTLPLSNNNWDNISAVSLPTKYKEQSFDNDDLNILMQVYKIMFPKANILSSHLSRIIKMYTNLNIFGVQYGSKKEYRSQKMSGVLASWPQNDGQINEKTVSMDRLTFISCIPCCWMENTRNIASLVSPGTRTQKTPSITDLIH
jgi:hypothetical protein